ncbi:MAG: hypothetical protein ACXVCL_17805 [Bdellovibrio sp.]
METVIESKNVKSELIVVGKAKRLKRIEKCIYGIFGIRILSVLIGYSIALKGLSAETSISSSLDIISGPLTFDALLFVLGYFVIQDLKKEKAWAWVGAVTFFVLSSGSLWTLPIVILGLINLIHEETRTDFLKKIDL